MRPAQPQLPSLTPAQEHMGTPALLHLQDKGLKDNIAELEQDFFLFKEETTNNLQHLLNLTSHHNVHKLNSSALL